MTQKGLTTHGQTGTRIDRGDPSTVDIDQTSLTQDNAFHDCDLSSIVLAGAIAVDLYFGIKDTPVGTIMELRKNGNSHTSNIASIYTQVANGWIVDNATVACDTGRIIEYKISEVLTSAFITVTGWHF